MASMESPEKRLAEVILTLEQEGFLDIHFRLAQSVKRVNGSFAFLELLANFRSDCQATLRAMTHELDKPIVSFRDLDLLCVKLKGSASSLGVPRIKHACNDLRRAISNDSKEECVVALNRIKHEYEVMQDKFNLISQLERRSVQLYFQRQI